MGLLAALVVLGCRNGSGEPPESKRSAAGAPAYRIIKPQQRTINYAIDQPGFVDAYEQTSIFSKVSGFIKQFYADIGQEVKKGELLAEIFVPELVEDHEREGGPGRAGQEAGRPGRAVGGRGPEQRADERRPARRGQGQRRQVPGRGGSLGVGAEAAHQDGARERGRQAGAGRNAKPVRLEHRRPQRRRGHGHRARGRQGDRRGQSRQGPDRRRGPPGRGQSGRGRRADGGRDAGLHQGSPRPTTPWSRCATPTRATTCRPSAATSRRPIRRPCS